MSRPSTSKEVNIEDCWLYARVVDKRGYGTISVWLKDEKRMTTCCAHRVMYENMVGAIPEGLELNHLCEVKTCINPDHLEAITHKQNMWYSQPFGDNRCKRGHELTEDNVYTWYKNTSLHRQCRKCSMMKSARVYRGKRKDRT